MTSTNSLNIFFFEKERKFFVCIDLNVDLQSISGSIWMYIFVNFSISRMYIFVNFSISKKNCVNK